MSLIIHDVSDRFVPLLKNKCTLELSDSGMEIVRNRWVSVQHFSFDPTPHEIAASEVMGVLDVQNSHVMRFRYRLGSTRHYLQF